MRIGVVTDATCDLPPEFIREYGIGILPMTIGLGDGPLLDDRDPERTLRFYTDPFPATALDAEIQPLSADEIRNRFVDRIVLDYDYVFCVTITATRSPMFENATKASFAILADYKSTRAAAGIHEPFALRVVDSRNLCSGTAVLVAEAAKLARLGSHPHEIRRRLDELRDNICGYVAPYDLHYIRTRSTRKGEKSVSLISYAISSALDIRPVILCYRGETQPVARIRSHERAVERMLQHVARRIEQGIDSRHVCLSYGGDPAQIPQLPGYARLAAAAQAREVELLTSMMSATAAVNTGERCVTVAYGGDLRSFGD